MSRYPSPEQILSLSTVCVGVGPGGTTSMLAYALFHSLCAHYLTACTGESSVCLTSTRSRRVSFNVPPQSSIFRSVLHLTCYAKETRYVQGECLLDTFVRPTMDIQDYREATTGIKNWQLFSSTSSICSLYTLKLTRTSARFPL
jgi:hypothetical protein